MRSHLEQAIEALGARLGTELALDNDGRLAVALDDIEIAILYVAATDEVHFYTPLGAVPDEGAEPFLRILLAGNHMGRLTGGAAIAVDPEGDTVSLNLRAGTDGLSADLLERRLEDFANLARSWQGAMPALGEAASDAADADMPPRTAAAPLDLDMIRV
ncbi:type III secretion system chaperone [Marivita sp. GX14005]|uniref:type III secretion system chaperone n=1 Tax=Marivita sp. GX14005 TaxID=2942276 RepID=UPI002018BDE1|nr:type III secretion system chaperone [Marivita sp. GX14005]MCL3883328.1 type III secretion system chaperone [Marivita sp. GX14005]